MAHQRRIPPAHRRSSDASRAPQGRRGGRRRDGGRPPGSGAAPLDYQRQPIAHAVPMGLSFGNFDFQELKSLGKRGGGVRELSTLLRQARSKATHHSEMLRTRSGAAQRGDDLMQAAMQRASGVKVKDDPHKISKALAKRRNKKRQSAKRWATRIQNLEKSVENVVKDRSIQRQTMRARKEAKKQAKEKRKGGAAAKTKGPAGSRGGKGSSHMKSKKQQASGGKSKGKPQRRK